MANKVTEIAVLLALEVSLCWIVTIPLRNAWKEFKRIEAEREKSRKGFNNNQY